MHVGHLLDRALMPQLYFATSSFDAVDQVAIDEWMGASPVYTGRMRRQRVRCGSKKTCLAIRDAHSIVSGCPLRVKRGPGEGPVGSAGSNALHSPRA